MARAAGRLIYGALPNGITSEYGYDAADRLTQLVHLAPDRSILLGVDYKLNANGMRSAVVRTDADGSRTGVSYGYDSLNRLTEVLNIQYLDDRSRPSNRSDNLLEEYTYDAAGNRLTELPLHTNEPVQDRCSYNAGNQLLRIERATDFFSGSTGNFDETFEYDRNGNLILHAEAERTTSYQYDFANRLIAAEGEGISRGYVYDGAGNRVVALSDGVTHHTRTMSTVLGHSYWSSNPVTARRLMCLGYLALAMR